MKKERAVLILMQHNYFLVSCGDFNGIFSFCQEVKMSIKKIGERLREARKAKGLQQKDMSEKLQISRAGYSRMENGKVEITTKNLVIIADILDISMDWLILGKEVNQTGLNFSDFEKYAGAVEAMFTDMKEDKATMHGVLSYFFERKGKESQNLKIKEEKEDEL